MQVAKKPAGIRMTSLEMSNDHPTSPSAVAMKLQAEAVESPYDIVRKLASGNAVVVFSMSGCCMCTVAKRLLFGLGVGPTIVELDHLSSGRDIHSVLLQLLNATTQSSSAKNSPPSPSSVAVVPAVFVGGKFLGGIETLLACHINGTLVPLLKEAGALWL